MQEERIKILSLLEQGVITVDEAVKLINAIQSIDINQEVHSYDVLNKMSDTIETIARDISKRTKTISKDLEPKIKYTTKTIGEKTTNVLDEISKSINTVIEKYDNKNEIIVEEKVKEDTI